MRVFVILFSFLLVSKTAAQTADSLIYHHVQAFSIYSIGIGTGFSPLAGSQYSLPAPGISWTIVGTRNERISMAYKLKVTGIGLNTAKLTNEGIDNGDFPQRTTAYKNLTFGFSPSFLAGFNLRSDKKPKNIMLQGLIGITALDMPNYRLIYQDSNSKDEFLHTNRIISPGLAAELGLLYRKKTPNRYVFLSATVSYLQSVINSSYKSNNAFRESEKKEAVTGLVISFSFSPLQYFEEE